jgi:hypothetical protein
MAAIWRIEDCLPPLESVLPNQTHPAHLLRPGIEKELQLIEKNRCSDVYVCRAQ